MTRRALAGAGLLALASVGAEALDSDRLWLPVSLRDKLGQALEDAALLSEAQPRCSEVLEGRADSIRHRGLPTLLIICRDPLSGRSYWRRYGLASDNDVELLASNLPEVPDDAVPVQPFSGEKPPVIDTPPESTPASREPPFAVSSPQAEMPSTKQADGGFAEPNTGGTIDGGSPPASPAPAGAANAKLDEQPGTAQAQKTPRAERHESEPARDELPRPDAQGNRESTGAATADSGSGDRVIPVVESPKNPEPANTVDQEPASDGAEQRAAPLPEPEFPDWAGSAAEAQCLMLLQAKTAGMRGVELPERAEGIERGEQFDDRNAGKAVAGASGGDSSDVLYFEFVARDATDQPVRYRAECGFGPTGERRLEFSLFLGW